MSSDGSPQEASLESSPEISTTQILDFQGDIDAVIFDIVRHVAEAFGVTPDQIRMRSRVQYIVFARYVAMWVAYRAVGLSNGEISQHFGYDHSTVLHGIAVIEIERSRSKKLHHTLDAIFAIYRDLSPTFRVKKILKVWCKACYKVSDMMPHDHAPYAKSICPNCGSNRTTSTKHAARSKKYVPAPQEVLLPAIAEETLEVASEEVMP